MENATATKRTARCGHEVPSHPGPQRKKCESCQPGQTWVYEPQKPRRAQCGHEVPPHIGRPHRYCVACSPTETLKSCDRCGTELVRNQQRWCSAECGEIATGRRRVEPLASRICALPGCEVAFVPSEEKTRCCSERHGKMLYSREARASGRVVHVWDDKARDRYHRRRARKSGASTGAPVELAIIAERDGWRCHLCRKRVGKKVRWPHPRSASLDHLVPLSVGGAHDPANVRLAHLVCNTRKGNRAAGDQLLLLGDA